MPPYFRVKKLRHRPRHPTQVEAHAVFRRRQIQFFRHRGVYMHYSPCFVKQMLDREDSRPALPKPRRSPLRVIFSRNCSLSGVKMRMPRRPREMLKILSSSLTSSRPWDDQIPQTNADVSHLRPAPRTNLSSAG